MTTERRTNYSSWCVRWPANLTLHLHQRSMDVTEKTLHGLGALASMDSSPVSTMVAWLFLAKKSHAALWDPPSLSAGHLGCMVSQYQWWEYIYQPCQCSGRPAISHAFRAVDCSNYYPPWCVRRDFCLIFKMPLSSSHQPYICYHWEKIAFLILISFALFANLTHTELTISRQNIQTMQELSKIVPKSLRPMPNICWSIISLQTAVGLVLLIYCCPIYHLTLYLFCFAYF